MSQSIALWFLFTFLWQEEHGSLGEEGGMERVILVKGDGEGGGRCKKSGEKMGEDRLFFLQIGREVETKVIIGCGE